MFTINIWKRSTCICIFMQQLNKYVSLQTIRHKCNTIHVPSVRVKVVHLLNGNDIIYLLFLFCRQVLDAVTRKERSQHCKRSTRGVQVTVTAISALLERFRHRTNLLGVPL